MNFGKGQSKEMQRQPVSTDHLDWRVMLQFKRLLDCISDLNDDHDNVFIFRSLFIKVKESIIFLLSSRLILLFQFINLLFHLFEYYFLSIDFTLALAVSGE